MDGTDLPARFLFIDMDLVAQRKKFCLDKIAGSAGLVIDIIAVRPGENPLLDQHLHTIASFAVIITQTDPKCKKNAPQPAVDHRSTGC